MEMADEIQQVFSSEGVSVALSSSVYVREPIDLPPLLVFALGDSAGRFVAAMAGDLWAAFRRGLVRTVLLFNMKWGQTPEIQLRFKEDDGSIIINLPHGTEELIEEALSKLPSYLEECPKGIGWIIYDRDSQQWEAYL